MAAQQIMTDGTDVAVGSGVESISLVQMGGINLKHFTEEHLLQVKPALWMTMIETAEIVAERYGISRERCRRIFPGKPEAHRRRPGRGQIQRRDRAARPPR